MCSGLGLGVIGVKLRIDWVLCGLRRIFRVELGLVGVVSSSRLKLRSGSGLGFQIFVFCLSLRFEAGVRRLIGVFQGLRFLR